MMTPQELEPPWGRRWRCDPPGVDRMAVSAGCPCQCRPRPRPGGAPPALSALLEADRTLVWLQNANFACKRELDDRASRHFERASGGILFTKER